jgi:signal transduction histidine kinase
VGQASGLQVDLSIGELPDALPREVELAAYRIFQEAMSNAIKHSGARNLRCELEAESSILQGVVKDDGVGFDANGLTGESLGLEDARGRARLMGGDLRLYSKPGHGTEIRFRLPLPSELRPYSGGSPS